MRGVIERELGSTRSAVESASAERTIEYETNEGVIKEKTTVNYKVDSGNVIDKTIEEVRNSEYIKKAGSTAKTAASVLIKISITFAIIGAVLFFVGVLSGIIH